MVTLILLHFVFHFVKTIERLLMFTKFFLNVVVLSLRLIYILVIFSRVFSSLFYQK